MRGAAGAAPMLLGAHVGITGGVERAPPVAKSLGCDVMQIFTKNQMQWKAAPLKADSVEAFKRLVKESGLGPTLVHCSYLLNCASVEDELWQKSIDGLVVEVERADALGIPYVTFHPGSPKDKGSDWGCKRVGDAVAAALERTKGAKPMILLETNAGQGAAVGRTFSELAAMMQAVPSAQRKRVGICFDTCHVYVSGYDIRSEEGYADTFDTFDNEIGLAHLKAFHLNDSKEGLDSKKDRHAPIGEGKLGLEAFRRLVNDKRFADAPGYLETPGGEESYAAEIQTLRKLVAKK
jgi:deoxyribonuclease IV